MIAAMSNSLTLARPPIATDAPPAVFSAPAISANRSSVGPTPNDDIQKTPVACVARYTSADTRR
jgi:hypothetical protein